MSAFSTAAVAFDEAFTAFKAADRNRIAREDSVWRLANRMEANPELAYEAITGTSQWFDDTSDDEIEHLIELAAEQIEQGLYVGGEHLRRLIAAEMALGWVLQARCQSEERAPVSRPRAGRG